MTQSPYADPRIASVYARVTAPLQFARAAHDLVAVVALQTGMNVLDVGTGTGAVASHAIGAVGGEGLVVGVDESIEMIRLARTETAYQVAVAQTPGLPFRDGQFDVVMAGFVVSHFADYDRGLADMVRVCRHGGRVGMTAWGSMQPAAAALWSDTAGQFVASERLDRAFRAHIPWDAWFSRADRIQQALEHAGLARVAVETREYRFEMSTADFLTAREASVQGLVLRQSLAAADWNTFTRHVGDVFRARFGETLEYDRDVHFGIGIKPLAS